MESLIFHFIGCLVLPSYFWFPSFPCRHIIVFTAQCLIFIFTIAVVLSSAYWLEYLLFQGRGGGAQVF